MKRILLLIGVLLMSNWKVVTDAGTFDLEDDYGLHVNHVTGVGSPRSTLSLDEYALIAGGKVSGKKVQPRQFMLGGTLTGTCQADLHAQRQALTTLFSDKVVFEYVGAAVTKRLDAYYAGGLEYDVNVNEPCYWERVALRFVVPSPFWYGTVEQSETLDANDSVSYKHAAARLMSTGQWSALGITSDPVTAVPWIAKILVSPDGNDVYYAGWFESWNGVDGADNIVRYDVVAGTWNMVGPAHTFDAATTTIYDLAFGPDGTLYIVGNFTDVGDANGDYITSWKDGAFTSLGTGLDNIGQAVAVGLDGTLFVGGEFHNAGGNPAMHIAQWNGAVWAAVGAGLDDEVNVIVVDIKGNVIIGGIFTDVNGGPGGTYPAIIGWDGSAYYPLSTGMYWAGGDAEVWSLEVGANNVVYAGGLFDTAGGMGGPNISAWNGWAWSPLGDGSPTDVVHNVVWAPDGMLYSVGNYAGAGEAILARWTGYVWAWLDAEFPNFATAAMAVGEQDSDVEANYDLWFGSSHRGTAQWAGIATITNNGTAEAYPTVTIGRSGGTSAVLRSMRNETTGEVILFDYSLVDGETLTIDLAPGNKEITSDYFGLVQGAHKKGDQFGTFSLEPGDNDVTCFVLVEGAPTIIATLTWYNQYRSLD